MHTFIYANTYTHAHTCTRPQTCTHILMRTHACIYVHTLTHTHIRTYMHIYTCTYILAYKHTYVHIYVCTHAYTHNTYDTYILYTPILIHLLLTSRSSLICSVKPPISEYFTSPGDSWLMLWTNGSTSLGSILNVIEICIMTYYNVSSSFSLPFQRWNNNEIVSSHLILLEL